MAASMDGPSGFRRLHILFDESCKCRHTLFFKPNKTRVEDPDKPLHRTILVLNVPPYCNEQCLRELFSGKFGSVESVTLQKSLSNETEKGLRKPMVAEITKEELKYFSPEPVKGFKIAFIIFFDPDSLSKAAKFKENNAPVVLSKLNKPVLVGMKKWVQEYHKIYPDKKALQGSIDTFMTKYDNAVELVEQKEKEQDDIPDEEGWVKVTRRGKTPVVARTEANQIKARTREKLKKKKRELINIYSYQIRESKREKVAELRRKFEEDKVRIQSMRDARKFKPF